MDLVSLPSMAGIATRVSQGKEHLNVAGEFGGWKRCFSSLPQQNPYQKCLKHSETSEVVWSCSMQETAMSS